jgi:hypothetical protein
MYTLLFRTIQRPLERMQITLFHSVADNVQEIIKKQCEFAQYSTTSEYAIMIEDIVLEIKGGKP